MQDRVGAGDADAEEKFDHMHTEACGEAHDLGKDLKVVVRRCEGGRKGNRLAVAMLMSVLLRSARELHIARIVRPVTSTTVTSKSPNAEPNICVD